MLLARGLHRLLARQQTSAALCRGALHTCAPPRLYVAAPTPTPQALLQPSLAPSSRSVGSAWAGRSDRLICSAKGSEGGTKTKLKYDLRPITKDDIEVTYSRSSGSGGQNVNKLSTKADVRFDLSKQKWIPDEVKDAIRQAEKNRFTKDGVLVMSSQRFRTQAQNLDDALSKLQDIITAGVEAVTPAETDPETIKRVKQNIKAGKERKLDSKKKTSMKKQGRSKKVSLD